MNPDFLARIEPLRQAIDDRGGPADNY